MSRIPKSFMVAGITVKVEEDGELVKKRSMMGEARYIEQKILMDTNAVPDETAAQVFFHEKVHWALYIMNEDDLRNNEKFVDLLAHLLYQMDKTAVFEE